jgi:hypothetical protein
MKSIFNIYLDILDIVLACPPPPSYCHVAHCRIASHRPASRSPLSIHHPLVLRCCPPSPLIVLSVAYFCLPRAVQHPPPTVIQYPLAPQIIARFDCSFIIILLTTHFFRTQQIVKVVVSTITITSMWTRQSSPPPINLFIIMLLSSSSLMLHQFSMVMDILLMLMPYFIAVQPD